VSNLQTKNTFEKTRNSSIHVGENRDMASPLRGRTNQAQELLAYIVNEVRRFVTTKRINDGNIMELD
jgi:hypothetical protein